MRPQSESYGTSEIFLKAARDGPPKPGRDKVAKIAGCAKSEEYPYR